jgi:hypothetical protein
MNQDILYHILLYSNTREIINMSSTNKSNLHLCDNHFWIEKFKLENLYINNKYNNFTKWIKSYDKTKKIHCNSHKYN